MRGQIILIALVAAAVAASGVNAAGTANPKDLLLRSSDMPAGATRVSFGGTQGAIKIPQTVHGKAAYAAFKFKNGSRRETVGEALGVLASSSDAHAVFAKLKAQAPKALFQRLSLRRYGNEQFAFGTANRGVAIGVLVVRSGSEVWELVAGAYPGFTKSGLIAEMQKYAAKAKARAT